MQLPWGLAVSEPFVDVQGLSRRYVQGTACQTVLDAVDFTLARGETVALLGRSGSGKSTLLNLLSGIDLPDAGSIRVAGQDLTGLDERQRTWFRRRHIGFVYQGFNLLPTLTAQENIALLLELNDSGSAAALREARQLLDAVGLADKAGHYPPQLSGGEQQRIAILRALAHRPALVLADEPTGNLDARTGAVMLQFLRERLQAARSTTLLVTHSLSVARTADRLLTLEDGKLTERGSDLAW